jgi:hypothetical protein
MNQPFDHERTRQLLTTGHLPAWAAWLLLLVLSAAVCWQLQRELAAAPLRLVVRWLLGLRVAVVALAVWLLCQPVLLVTDHWRESPRLVTLTIEHPSLQVREDFGAPHRGLDVLEALEQRSIEGRVAGASAVGLALERLAATLEQEARRAARESEHLGSALPPRPAFTEALPRLKQALLAGREDLARRHALLPAKLANEQLSATRETAASRLRAFAGALQAAAGEVDVVQVQGAAFPELIGKFAAKLEVLGKDARGLAAEWHGLQAAMDEAASASTPALRAALDQARTRRDFAKAAAARIAAQAGLQVSHMEGKNLADGLRWAMAAESNAPAAIVLLDDGTAPLTEAARAAAGSGSESGVAIHAALIGTDGAEPPDAGLIAVECPGVAVAGQRVTARVLTKVILGKGTSAKLVATAGETVLAQAEVKESGVVTLPLRFDQSGRQSVVFELQTGEPDTHPGNQLCATVIDVVARPLRVLVLSDAMNADFVLMRGVCDRLPQLRVDSILLDPQLGKFSVGGEPGQFPGTPEQWQSVAAVVLLGTPNALLPPEARNGLHGAILAGLHVLVIASDALDGLPPASEQTLPPIALPTGGWLPALGFSQHILSGSSPVMPSDDLWLPFYALGRDEEESRARWEQLPAPWYRVVPRPAGIPLSDHLGLQVAADQNGANRYENIQLLPQGRGGVLHVGLTAFASLRNNGNSAPVNRLVAGLVEATARPWSEGEDGLLLFPPQPVAGRKQFASFDSLAPADLSGATFAKPWLTASDAKEISFTHNGQKFRRPIHHLLSAGDFALAPHAGPLEEVARLGRGRFVQMVDLPELLNDLHLAPRECQDVRSYRLWSGGWPLAVLLLLVSTEYLLRRRAGRVM